MAQESKEIQWDNVYIFRSAYIKNVTFYFFGRGGEKRSLESEKAPQADLIDIELQTPKLLKKRNLESFVETPLLLLMIDIIIERL